MQKVTRRIFIGAMVLLLATSMSVGVSSKAFAAQSKNGKLPDKYIQGYLVNKDGRKTPVYNTGNNTNNTPKAKSGLKTPYAGDGNDTATSDPSYPTLPNDPNQPTPQKGTITTETGDIGNILYFSGDASYTPPPEQKYPDNGKWYLEKKSDGKIEIGVYDPKTYKLYPLTDMNAEYVQKGEAEMIKEYGPFFAWSKAFDSQNKLKRETYFEKLAADQVDKSSEYNFKKEVKSGVATEDVVSLASTLGVKSSFEAGIPDLGKFTAEISASLTSTFQHSITLTKDTTISRSFTSPPANNPNYQYPTYVGAAYQLTSTYTLEPGPGLQQFLKDTPDFQGLANTSYNYDDDQMYFGVTPGSHITP